MYITILKYYLTFNVLYIESIIKKISELFGFYIAFPGRGDDDFLGTALEVAGVDLDAVLAAHAPEVVIDSVSARPYLAAPDAPPAGAHGLRARWLRAARKGQASRRLVALLQSRDGGLPLLGGSAVRLPAERGGAAAAPVRLARPPEGGALRHER